MESEAITSPQEDINHILSQAGEAAPIAGNQSSENGQAKESPAASETAKNYQVGSVAAEITQSRTTVGQRQETNEPVAFNPEALPQAG
jgi:hypothetical protein